MTNAESSIEFEHKFVVESNQRNRILNCIRALEPNRAYAVEVDDHYFFKPSHPTYIYRYRKDHQLNQLTVKSLASDSERRLELNLNLDRLHDIKAVSAFLDTLGPGFSKTIHKKVDVFYFDDVEIVYYDAFTEGQSISCVEVEWVGADGGQEPLLALARYESRLGLDPSSRSLLSLFHLLLWHQMPANWRQMVPGPKS